ncbi:MAG: type IV secretion system protein, partial [bacterium]|nr:type IV secretion system protein [bacterium]
MQIRKILIKKTNLPLLAVFVVFGLFFQHQTADAIAFLAALPLIGQAILQGTKDALSSINAQIMPLLIWTASLSALSSVFLTFAASFLDYTSNLPIKLDNNLVTTGWNFTSGLVNSIFILIFLAIVLAYIFNKANYEIKKTLPRLIIIALLLNFSMLFVKIFLDFGWIVQNSVRSMFFGDHNLALEVMAPLKVWLLNVHSKIFGQIVAYILSGLIPGGDIIKGIRMATVVLGEGMFGTFSQAFTLIAFGFVGGLTFFVYGIFFLARIIVIYLLAIAAPLALAAYILPPTQKYFWDWLKALAQWTFSGVVVFFLMGLGLKLYTDVAPATVLAGFFNDGYLKFIFLLVYLWIVLIYSKKLLPKGMEVVWKATEMAMGAGIAATSVGGWRAGKALTSGAGTAQHVYASRRLDGWSRRQALGEAARQGWADSRVQNAIGPSAVKKGFLKALGNMGNKAKFEAMTGLGGKNLPFGIRFKPPKMKPGK